MLSELPSDMNGVSTTPAALHLFNVDYGAQKLDEEKAQLFHHLVAKLLYLSWRSTTGNTIRANEIQDT